MAKLMLNFADNLYRDLATVSEGPPICCLHNNDLYWTNCGLTKEREINVFTLTLPLCLKLKP
jgi:hypothetical protein